MSVKISEKYRFKALVSEKLSRDAAMAILRPRGRTLRSNGIRWLFGLPNIRVTIAKSNIAER
jgi:hypothetical protein